MGDCRDFGIIRDFCLSRFQYREKMHKSVLFAYRYRFDVNDRPAGFIKYRGGNIKPAGYRHTVTVLKLRRDIINDHNDVSRADFKCIQTPESRV